MNSVLYTKNYNMIETIPVKDREEALSLVRLEQDVQTVFLTTDEKGVVVHAEVLAGDDPHTMMDEAFYDEAEPVLTCKFCTEAGNCHHNGDFRNIIGVCVAGK